MFNWESRMFSLKMKVMIRFFFESQWSCAAQEFFDSVIKINRLITESEA